MSGRRRSSRTRSGSAAASASCAGGRPFDLESFAPEPLEQGLGDRILVFDDQNSHAAHGRSACDRGHQGFSEPLPNPGQVLAGRSPAPNRAAPTVGAVESNGGQDEQKARIHDLAGGGDRRNRRRLRRHEERRPRSLGGDTRAGGVFGDRAAAPPLLDRTEIALRKALAQQPPRLPSLPATLPAGRRPPGSRAPRVSVREAGATHRDDPPPWRGARGRTRGRGRRARGRRLR